MNIYLKHFKHSASEEDWNPQILAGMVTFRLTSSTWWKKENVLNFLFLNFVRRNLNRLGCFITEI